MLYNAHNLGGGECSCIHCKTKDKKKRGGKGEKKKKQKQEKPVSVTMINNITFQNECHNEDEADLLI